MRNPTWKQCSACAARLIRSSSQIQRRFSPGRGFAVKSQGRINLIPWKSQESQNASEMASPASALGAGRGIAAPWDDLRAVAGAEHLRAAGAVDDIIGVRPQMVFEPDTETELAAVLRFGDAAGFGVVPRGGGTKTGWGNPPTRADLILSTARLNRIIEHAWADLTVSAEAGCTIQNLQSALAEHGQCIAVDPLWPERATVGGILSTNDSGTLRIRYGALRDLIIGVTIALPDGTLASSGGKVVKNVAGYDLPKLATGALGTLGVITRAVFRLHPLPWGARTVSFTARELPTMQAHILAIQDSKLAHTALQIRCAAGGEPRADILFEATEAGLNAQDLQLRKLLGSTSVEESPKHVWNARQDLFTPEAENVLIGKISVLPAEIAKTMEVLERIAGPRKLHWQAVAQATGIAMLRLEGGSAQLSRAAEDLRSAVEGGG